MSTRERITEAALRLALVDGLGGLSVRAVAREAGVGATTLRHYFPTQAELYRVIAARYVNAQLSDLGIADADRDPVQRLHECLVQFLAPADQPDQRLSLESWFELHRTALAPDALPTGRETLVNGHHSSADVLTRWLTTLAEQGHLAAEGVAGHAGTALALISGLHLTMLIDPERFDHASAVRSLLWFARGAITG
ncbi:MULTISPECIES: TetR/AcrR family transcriptional regulator [Actinosynnema]|uniref:TetR/AcrR family transcriptional regulator n=1 Tax=Actinosynnema TaxID=40566 RepID=UPI0020A32B64|nr:TetR/AcrR family transcriptional regulator [Actinosynnema pretiosum]MCP2098722.1 transcriptional regulator, TetR family [Actinosynnema pretiosum]